VAPPPHTDLVDELEVDNRFDPRPLDEGSPARIIATMVGIVGILLLGSLFWSALGALVGALGTLPQSLPPGPKPAPVLVVTVLPTPVTTPVPTLVSAPTALPTTGATAEAPTPTAEATVAPTAESAGRAPWVLLPQPQPGTRVAVGQITVEARGRGDAAITEIKLEVDGAALRVSLEQRGDNIWRGFASTRVDAGQHNVRAIVVDEKGRSGSYRWSFDAAP
jgi:hypothetical protein